MARKKAPVETDDSPGAKESKRRADLHARAVKRYKELQEWWADNHSAAEKDIKFRSGDHWPEKIKAQREKKGRPCLVFDKVSQYIRQTVNDGRQNRPSIKYRPVDDKGDIKVANGFQGIARHILTASNADEAFDTALDHAAGHGFGFFRVLTDYVDEKAFEQDIRVVRVRNSLSVLLAPHQSADGSDAEDGFIIDDVSRETFERKWPKAEKVDWKADRNDYAEGWLSELTVRVCEYWYKEPVTIKLHLLADGTTATEDDYERDSRPDKPAIVRSREAQDVRVKWCRMTGAEILEERDWAGKFIPIIPVYGTETDVKGKVSYSGLVRPARDPQLLYDFSRSAFAERVALSPKAPWVAAEGQVEGHPEWNTAHTENHPVLTYTPQEVGGTILPAPRRETASDIPTGFAQDAQMSEHDIQAAIGVYNASLGAPSNEKSGRAIMARQREGDVATFHYHDNLNRAVRYLGRILLDLIPKIYDTKRVIRIVGEDGKVDMAMVNPDLNGPYAKVPLPNVPDPVPVFNLNAGRYDVDVSTGPSYTTKRQESAAAMLEAAQANPAYWQTHGDLIVKSQDWPDADQFAKRSLALMPPEVRAAIEAAERDEDDDQGPSPEVRALMEQAEQAVQQRDEQIAQMGQALEQAKEIVADLEERTKTAEQRAMEAAQIKLREIAIKEREVEIKEAESTARLIEMQRGEQEAQAAQESEGEGAAKQDAILQMVSEIAVAVDGIGQAVAQLAEDAAAPVEIVPGADGRAAGFRKGRREMSILRGPDGRATGVQ